MIGFGSLSLFFALGWASFNTQWAPQIVHDPVDCIVPGQYLVIEATIHPSSDIRAAKVYFRSDKYPKFYFVQMAFDENGFRCVIPKPSAETSHIVYYIEAVDATFNNAIGAEHTAAVQETCDRGQPFPNQSGEEPRIIVGATEAGLSKLPPGFEAAGIIGTVTSAGLLTGVGGGPGIGTAAAIAGAAAGAGGLAVAATRSTETTTTVPAVGTADTVTTTVVTTTIPVTTTTPASPGPGSSSSTTTTIVPATTTVPSTTTTPLSLTACFTVSDADGPSGCKVSFDASCSAGNIVDYEWRFQDDPPATVNGPSPTTSYDWTSDPACGGPFTRLVRLTVTGIDSSTTQTQVNINPNSPTLTATLRAPLQRLQSSFQSQLLLPPAQRRLEAVVILNGSQRHTVDNSAPYGHRTTGKRGWNTVEGYLSFPCEEPVFWKFDFAGSEHFEAGSIHVEAGVIATKTAYSIVVRLSGTPGERVRLKYRLSP